MRGDEVGGRGNVAGRLLHGAVQRVPGPREPALGAAGVRHGDIEAIDGALQAVERGASFLGVHGVELGFHVSDGGVHGIPLVGLRVAVSHLPGFDELVPGSADERGEISHRHAGVLLGAVDGIEQPGRSDGVPFGLTDESAHRFTPSQ